MVKRSFLKGKNYVFRDGKGKSDRTQYGRGFHGLEAWPPAGIRSRRRRPARRQPAYLHTVSKITSKPVRNETKNIIGTVHQFGLVPGIVMRDNTTFEVYQYDQHPGNHYWTG